MIQGFGLCFNVETDGAQVRCHGAGECRCLRISLHSGNDALERIPVRCGGRKALQGMKGADMRAGIFGRGQYGGRQGAAAVEYHRS